MVGGSLLINNSKLQSNNMGSPSSFYLINSSVQINDDIGSIHSESLSIDAYDGAIFYRSQAFTTTANATPAVIKSILLNEEEAITVTGSIIGSDTTHTDTTGGTFTIVARRTTAGNITQVSITTADVKADTTATFTADVDIGTQSVRILVTGLLATTYNWACTFEYQKILLS